MGAECVKAEIDHVSGAHSPAMPGAKACTGYRRALLFQRSLRSVPEALRSRRILSARETPRSPVSGGIDAVQGRKSRTTGGQRNPFPGRGRDKSYIRSQTMTDCEDEDHGVYGG